MNEFTNTKVKDYIRQPKEEYEKILDSLRTNYQQKQTLLNTNKNKIITNTTNSHISSNSYNNKHNNSEINTRKNELLQYIKSKPKKNTDNLNFTSNISNNMNTHNMNTHNMNTHNKNDYTRKQYNNKEIIYPTEDIQIRDDVSVFTDYSVL
jgi:hypothetical protein